MVNKSKEALSAKWLDFSRQVIPTQASKIQIQEMRRAFYFGATALFSVISNISDELDEEEGFKVLEELTQELKDFTSKVGKDY